ncbi:MAG: hypothetical protein HY302_14615 [Opitutae bacterium]|nr:hypothetical protein [Opitutae bacterium]
MKKLRSRAAALGVSVEEAHRRLLRSVLVGNGPAPQADFIEYLRAIPQGKAVEFPRPKDLPRPVSF